MDCEKFDRVLLDLLYGELDELTQASAKRHTEHCTRCRAIVTELRATREVGSLPLVDPPEGLELKILEAERQARAVLPLRQRFGRAISVLAGYAMRPQLAMAALLLLMIGSSLVFLRARPGDRERVLVTERGVPESEGESLVVPMPERLRDEPAPAATLVPAQEAVEKSLRAQAAAAPAAPGASGDDELAKGDGVDATSAFANGVALFDEGRYVEARRAFESVATRGGERAPEAALYAARASRQSEGCSAASMQFEQVTARYPGTASALEATWQAADCYKSLGEIDQARRSYERLFSTSYEERARAALGRLEDETPAVAARKAKAASRPAAAGAAAAPQPQAAPPAKPATATDSAF
jgi:tetratricopeptide (TPR) repeat protein